MFLSRGNMSKKYTHEKSKPSIYMIEGGVEMWLISLERIVPVH